MACAVGRTGQPSGKGWAISLVELATEVSVTPERLIPGTWEAYVIRIRTHDGPKSQVSPRVHTPYLVLFVAVLPQIVYVLAEKPPARLKLKAFLTVALVANGGIWTIR